MSLFDRFRKEVPQSGAQLNPQGRSGRGHNHGFLDYDELNNELRGPEGIKIFDSMYRQDGDVRQVIGLSTNPVISGTWDFQPAGGEDAEDKELEIIDFLKWALFTVMSPNLVGHLAQALPVLCRAGFAPFEEVWMRQEFKGKEYLVLRTLDLRLPKTIWQWNTNANGELIELVQYLPVPNRNGDSKITLDMKNIVYYRIGAEGDNWEGTSLLRPAYKHWKLKDAIERIDAIAQEREAVGIPICYPPQGASPAQLDGIEEILSNIRANEQGYIVAPGPYAPDLQDGQMGWRFDILGFDRNGSGRDPQPSLKYHTSKIMAAFIAEFMLLGHGSTGARATAQVQADPFMDSIEALAGLVEEVLNEQIVIPLVKYNFPDVKEIPKLKMSLVDSTSLTQMSDFVSRLVQVGAILPDQKLENWLRERAELPPPDPKAVQARSSDPQKDFDTRREALTGPAMGAPEDAAPGGAGTGGGRKTAGGFGAKARPGLPHGTKPVPNRLKGAALRDELQDVDDDAVTLARREPDQYETHVHLDDIEMTLDAAPDDMVAALRDHIARAARYEMGLRHSHKSLPAGIQTTVRNELQRLSNYGYGTADDEIRRQLGDDTVEPVMPVMMSKDRIDDMDMHAEVAAEHILDSMKGAYKRATLMGHDAQAQSAAEQAGSAAAKQVARNHGFHAFNVGREQRILDSDDGDTIGVRYTSIIDRNRCAPCDSADDGVVRSLDDPVRIERRPPNRNCMSLMSGHNMCRCFEVPVVMGRELSLDADLVPNDPAKTNWVERRGGLPKKIADMAGDLISERGFTVSRAIATAVSQGRKLAATHPEWAAAMAEWDAKRASS